MKFFIPFGCWLLLCCIAGCTPCSTKKVTCSGFDEPAFTKWFPYQQGSRVIFKNAVTADTFSYTIEHVNTSGTYDITTGGFSTAAPLNCNSSAYFASANYDNSPFAVFQISYIVNIEQVAKKLELNFYNGTWETGEVFDSSLASCTNCLNGLSTQINKQQNVAFDNGRTYNDVIVLTSDTATNKFERAYKLFVAKNIGIIGCEMFPSKQKWVIQ